MGAAVGADLDRAGARVDGEVPVSNVPEQGPTVVAPGCPLTIARRLWPRRQLLALGLLLLIEARNSSRLAPRAAGRAAVAAVS